MATAHEALVGRHGLASRDDLKSWILSECSYAFRLRREDRRTVGRVLADLLEVRHRLLVLPQAMEVIRNHVALPLEAELPMRAIVETVMPDESELHNRYEAGVAAVAGKLPLLAFRLRARDNSGSALRKLREVASLNSQDAKALRIWKEAENGFLRRLLPPMEELILDLARMHGIRTWYRTRRKLKEGSALPEDFGEFLRKIVAESLQPENPPAPKEANI